MIWGVKHPYGPSSPGLKTKTHDFCRSFGLKHMSGERPGCVECQGKFGSSVWGQVCELCGLHRQIYSHLVSPRFPAEEKDFATKVVRECYHRILEHSDAVWELKRVEGKKEGPFPQSGPGQEQKEESKRGEGDKASPGLIAVKEEDPEEKVDKRPLEAPASESPREKADSTSPTHPPGLTGKAPPVKPPADTSHRELEDTPRKRKRSATDSRARGQEKEKEKRKKAKRKSRSPKSRSGSRRRRRRRHSREEVEPPRADSSEREQEGDRQRAKPSTVPSSSARRPRVPRSPSGPPPGRDFSGYYQAPVWEGPIPARGDQSGVRGSSPRAANKGVKKRLQQERAREKGWQFHHGKRWR